MAVNFGRIDFGERLPLQLEQLRLGVEQIDVTWSASMNSQMMDFALAGK